MKLLSFAINSVLHLILALALAPLLQAWIKKVKAFWQMRQGPSFFQTYRDLHKFWRKEEVVSEHTSWVFSITPTLVMASTLMAILILPNVLGWAPFSANGDLFWLIASLAIGRFFLALAGLDTAGTFGGMGTSRELFVSMLVEPAFLLAMVVLALMSGATSIGGISSGLLKYSIFSTPRLLSALALCFVAIAEMGRIPVDNPDTHLELTMIHEGMILEYSGRSLALLNWAEQVKQLLFLQLLIFVLWPSPTLERFSLIPLAANLVKLALLGAIFATLESITVKLRLFRLPTFLAAGIAAAILSLITLWVVKGGI